MRPRRYWTYLKCLCGCGFLLIIALHSMNGRGLVGNGRADAAISPLSQSHGSKPCDCPCKRNIGEEASPQITSTCSEEATRRGPGQKVISYSIFGSLNSSYFGGVEENLSGIRRHYPGFIMRLYHDRTSADVDDCATLCHLVCRNGDLDLCGVKHLPTFGDISDSFGMVWRFAPMCDPLVEEWHSRDLDSRISMREAAAVDDWRRNSAAKYHVMRDNPYHNTEILGGMFGMRQRGTEDLKELRKCFEKMLLSAHQKGGDQVALSKHLFPIMKRNQENVVLHDSYLCQMQGFAIVRPWPTKRDTSDDFMTGVANNFVGANGGSISLKTHGECPLVCRPKDHPEWKLC